MRCEYKTKLVALFACFVLAACGSTSSTDSADDDGTDSGGGGESAAIETTAGKAFPTDLAVSSPFTSSASSSVSASIGKDITDFETEQVELQNIIAGESAADCKFTISLFGAALANPECYGPTVNYTNHPGGGGGSMPGGDMGLWNAKEGTEACAAAKLNALINTTAMMVDSAVKLFAGMACSLNVDALELPSVGDTVDMKSGFENILSSNNMNEVAATTATLERSADDADGYAVYDYSFIGTLTNNSDARDVEFHLRHVPMDADNTTYKGKLSFWIAVGDSSPNSASAGSVLYNKSSADSLVIRMQSANYNASEGLPEPLSPTTRDIDPTNIYDDDPINGWNNNFVYILTSVDPETGAGSYSSAWSAGSNDEKSRAFNATMSVADDGTKSGCAYYGFGPKISSNVDLGSIEGMICNWTGPGNTRVPAALVQRQCMVESSGIFIPDPAIGDRITYAPTNSCDSDGGGFTYYTQDATQTGTMTNDNMVGDAVTNDLLPKADMSFTMPTVPADVY